VCGIAGIFDTSGGPVEAGLVARMASTMAHRGPDGQGVYADGCIGFGHRRLAIIDLTDAAEQPMANEDGSVVIVFNGAIYNFQRLRTELVDRGHIFRSHSDTEVIVHGYEEWGHDVVHHLNGMFAFAVWDERSRELFLARDRFGIKPLYYVVDRSRLIFGSEIKSILKAYPWDKQVDRGALLEYFTFQNIFTERTLFKGIHMLPAGHMASVRMGSPTVVSKSFWDVSFDSALASPMSFGEVRDGLRDLLGDSVTRHLISDVPVGSYLSGGMDSGSLVALASRDVDYLMTFTGGFDLSLATGLENNFDEREAAESMASLFGTDHYEMVLHAGSMERVMPRLVWHLEDLRVGMSYQNFYIAQLASRFVSVVLSGCGGDELFAGYPWRYLPLLRSSSMAEFDQTSYGMWQRLLTDDERQEFFSEDMLADTRDQSMFDIFRSVLSSFDDSAEWTPERALDREMYFETKTFLHGLLVVEDKIASAHALETRVPFLDNELVDFALGIPAEYRLRIERILKRSGGGGEDGPVVSSDGKYVLRSAMGGDHPGFDSQEGQARLQHAGRFLVSSGIDGVHKRCAHVEPQSWSWLLQTGGGGTGPGRARQRHPQSSFADMVSS